jgi:tetratricopeptide (TPR) repeat protein
VSRLQLTIHAAAGVAVLALAPAFGYAQVAHSAHHVPSVPAELLERPLPLRAGIGTAHDAVSTSSREAQAFYDQGLAYLHSYVWIEAARSFNQALRLDARLAMADVGLSIAYAELNAPSAARAALERARALAADVSAHDREHIEARASQMAAELQPRDAAKLAAYRSLLDAAVTRYPSDEEFWLLRGLAEASDPSDRGQGSNAASVRFYEKALALSPGHVAAHHYLTHACENTGRNDEALAYGAAYAKLAPAVPHAHHMRGHELRRLGRIDEAIAEFRAADTLESSYFETEQIPAEYDWHHAHNLDLLATSYQYLGQMKQAEALLKASFAIPSALVVQQFNKRAWPVFLIARGRADEALVAARVLADHPSPLVSATGHVEAGVALLAKRRFEDAAREANAALAALKSASDGGAMVASSLQALQGEFFLRSGQKKKGRALLERVARTARTAPGPDAWAQALFTLEAIARAAREVGDWEFSAWAANQMLEHDPKYAGTHYALALVAEHRGDARAARAEFARAQEYWGRADADLPELREIRSRIDSS